MMKVIGVMWTLEMTLEETGRHGVGTINIIRSSDTGSRLQRSYKKLGGYWVPRQYAIDLALALDVPMEEI